MIILLNVRIVIYVLCQIVLDSIFTPKGLFTDNCFGKNAVAYSWSAPWIGSEISS